MAQQRAPNPRQRRIIQLSQKWGVTLPPAASRLERPSHPPSYRTPTDDETAEGLLQRHAVDVAQVNRRRSGLSRAFSTNNLKKGKNWDPHHVLEVLTTYIAHSHSGTAGVVEALIAQLEASGADLGAMHIQKSGMLSRRKSLEGVVDRTKMLTTAVQNNQLEMVHVLLPHADPLSLDAALPLAIRQGNTPIAELLVRYGANMSQTAEGQDAFRRACSVPVLSDMIGVLVQSEGRPSDTLASQSMVDAARVGALDTVLQLSRTVADGDYNHAEALRVAVAQGRGDVAVAIVMGNRPPKNPGVSQAFAMVSHSQTTTPSTKLQIAELLLCAGAQGDVLSQALQKACDSHFYEMASLLAAYGVSIEYDGASVLRTAIMQGQLDLVSSLLNDSSTLSPELASGCVGAIPPQISNPDRHLLLSLLLKKGAKGAPLDEMLVVAAQNNDVASVELLVSPYFPETGRGTGHSQVGRRHEVASPDYKSGEALRTAVLRADTDMAGLILSAQPSPETLSAVFPLTKNLPTGERSQIIRLFLNGALSGPPLHAALQDALAEDPSTRDDSLVKLLLEHDADINYKNGPGLHAIIMQGDIRLMERLMQRASPQTAAARIPGIMKISDHRTRHDMMALMFRSGAAIGVEEVCSALVDTLREKPVDMSLLRLLLQRGNADIDNPKYPATPYAVANPDPEVLELVLTFGKPAPETISKSLAEIAALPPTDGKTRKFKVTLGKARRKEDLGGLLASEVRSIVQNSARQPATLLSLQLLLERGADPNDYQGAALCHAVAAANAPVFDILLECPRPPTAESLGAALPHALKITDSMDRMSFTKKLIDAGASPQEVNRGLVHSIANFTDDIFLIDTLASAADMSDGEALVLATSKASPPAVDKLLSQTEKHTPEAKDTALQKAMSVRDRAVRRRLCQSLLVDGVSPHVASSALLVAARDGDLELGDILMLHGANIASNGGQAIIEACRGGSAEVLEVLLRSEKHHPDKGTLERGFQAATEVGDLSRRAVIFEKLLDRGVSGEAVDVQLVSSARYGEQGQDALRVLLAAGADPNYNGGEAVVAATRSAFIGNLEALLGLWDAEGRQRKPSHPTLVKALKSSWNLSRDTRLQVVSSLFKAGLQPADDVHIALNWAVNEEDPDERLVKLLLDCGASPTANDCKTVVDAVKNSLASPASNATLSLVINGNLPQEAVDKAFVRCFTADNFHDWYCESGMSAMELLLGKGAGGGALSELLVLVMKAPNDTDETHGLAKDFFDIIVAHGPDVNHNSGEALQLAASQANTDWTARLLACRPSTESLSYAFQHIFDTRLDQTDALQLFEMFSAYRDGETAIDVMAQQPGTQPVLVRAMAQYPRSTKILQTLLDAGFYHDQITFYSLHDEEEEMTLLTWAVAQPQKKISSSLIELLLARGAKVNVASRLSETTPLMLAVQNRRPDVVKMMLLEGADVDVADCLGRSPLSMATDIGGDLAIEMMGYLLAAEPSRDDGSLHNAARELNLAAVKILMQAGHDPDFPSPCHDGRSALGEVCLKGSASYGDLTADRERAMQKVVGYLVDQGSDLTIKFSGGKSLVHLSLQSPDAVATTRVLLKAGMWKHINDPFNRYDDGTNTYSPTMYVKKLYRGDGNREELLQLLYANRATDVFYANEGRQPADAVGMPQDIQAAERARRMREERLAEESEDFALAMARKREQASVENQLASQRAELEDARRRKWQADDLSAIRSRAQLQESLEMGAHNRRVSEQRALTESAVARARAVSAAEIDHRRKMIDWDARAGRERVDNERALGAVRVEERTELDRLERAADERLARRLDAQNKVIESQERLARSIAPGPVGANQRRQIGYVSEELN